MIKVTLLTTNNNIVGFNVYGHAGYDDYGKDIVCASVSVLAINTVNSIEAFTQDKFEYDVKEGSLYFNIISNINEKSELLLNAFKLGIKGIEEQYGNQYIEVNFKEV